MKKGLLSLLAVALTVVGCQNYDDQFQGLTDQIQGIEAQINGLPDLTSQVNDIQSTVNALTTSLQTVSTNVSANGTAIANNATAIANNGTAISDVSDDVAAVQTQVNANGTAVAGVQGSVNTLSTDVANNATAIANNGTAIGNNGTAIGNNGTAIASNGTAIASNSTDIAGVLAQTVTNSNSLGLAQNDITQLLADLADVQTDIDAVQSSLTLVATTEDLNAVSAVIANISQDVDEILAGTTSVNQAINLTSDTEVQYAHGIITTGPTSPSSFIINGTGTMLTVDLSGVASTALKQVARDILGKVISVIGSGSVVVTSTGSDNVDMSRLTYIKGNLTMATAMPTLPNSIKVDGNVEFSGITGAIDFQDNTIGGNVTLDASSVNSVTSLNFQNNTISGSLTNAPLTLNNATYIHVGTAAVTGVIAPLATEINLLQPTITAAGLTVTSTGNSGGVINLASSVNGGAGSLTVVGSNTILNADGLSSITNITTTDVADANFGGVTTVSGTLSIDASGANSDVNLDSLTSIGAGTHSIGGVSVDLTALTGITATSVTFPDATTITFPDLSTTASVTANSAASLSAKSFDFDELSADAATAITASNQATSVAIVQSGSVFPGLQTLTIHPGGSSVAQNNTTLVTLEVTAGATLTTLNTDGKIDSATVTNVATINTNGYITDLVVAGASVTDLNLGHSYIGLDTAPTVDVQNTTIPDINFASVEKIKTIYLANNSALSDLTAPGSVYPLAAATISVTLSTNSFTGTYTEGATGTAGSETVSGTDAKLPVLAQEDIRSLLDWYNAAVANSSSANNTLTVEVDLITSYGTRADNATAPAYSAVASNLSTVYANDSYNTTRANTNAGDQINTTQEITETKAANPAD
jgi:phage tail protein X/uncharacterized protein YoxC